MSKKVYVYPQTTAVEFIANNCLLAGSVVGNVNGNPEIGWGGTDTEGNLTPQSNKRENYWEDTKTWK